MKVLKASDGNLLVWREIKVVSDKMYTPDNFDESVVEQLPKAEAEELDRQWREEESIEAERSRTDGAET